jgi:hypothetical protein
MALPADNDTRYRTTKKGKEYWSVLGDPTYLSKEDVERGVELRAAMTPRGWAMEQVCIQLETWGDDSRACTMAEMLEAGKYNWTSYVNDVEELPEPDEQLYYQYYHMKELMEELLEKGFIEKVPENVADAPQQSFVYGLVVVSFTP